MLNWLETFYQFDRVVITLWTASGYADLQLQNNLTKELVFPITDPEFAV